MNIRPTPYLNEEEKGRKRKFYVLQDMDATHEEVGRSDWLFFWIENMTPIWFLFVTPRTPIPLPMGGGVSPRSFLSSREGWCLGPNFEAKVVPPPK